MGRVALNLHGGESGDRSVEGGGTFVCGKDFQGYVFS